MPDVMRYTLRNGTVVEAPVGLFVTALLEVVTDEQHEKVVKYVEGQLAAAKAARIAAPGGRW